MFHRTHVPTANTDDEHMAELLHVQDIFSFDNHHYQPNNNNQQQPSLAPSSTIQEQLAFPMPFEPRQQQPMLEVPTLDLEDFSLDLDFGNNNNGNESAKPNAKLLKRPRTSSEYSHSVCTLEQLQTVVSSSALDDFLNGYEYESHSAESSSPPSSPFATPNINVSHTVKVNLNMKLASATAKKSKAMSNPTQPKKRGRKAVPVAEVKDEVASVDDEEVASISSSMKKQKRTKWQSEEVTALWEGIKVYGNNWRLIKKTSFGHRTYYQVKDKGRRVLARAGWTSGRTKNKHDGAADEAKTLAIDYMRKHGIGSEKVSSAPVSSSVEEGSSEVMI